MKTSKKIIVILIIILLVLLTLIYLKYKETEKIMNEDVVVLKTNYGIIEIKLNYEASPITCENFKQYVTNKHYDGTIFHRVISGFMIQGGGFNIDGIQKETLSPILLESKNGLKNLRGTVAMARTNEPNSATSQFFINLKDNDFLNYVNENNLGYAVFGEVISGMEVVDTIAKVKTGSNGYHNDWPKEDIIIENAYFK